MIGKPVDAPAALVTTRVPDPAACAGAVTWIVPSDTTMKFGALVPMNVMPVVPVKWLPVIRTAVPPAAGIVVAVTAPENCSAAIVGTTEPVSGCAISVRCQVTIATDGGIVVNSTMTNAATVVNILLFLDNGTFLAGRQYIVANNTGFVGVANWSFTTSVNGLAPGVHTFKVFAQWVGGAATAVVGGATGSLLQGALTVTMLNR